MAKATSNHFAHGHAGKKQSPTYVTWNSMRLRCNNPGNASYEHYGAKGITYCERWNTFANFLEDMGERPEGMTLDRIDRSKGYEPTNCRWATRKQQSQDRSITVWIEHDGRRLCLSDWAVETGIYYTTIKKRLDAGWSVQRALTTPPRPRRSVQQQDGANAQ